jgi:hypothetical protein
MERMGKGKEHEMILSTQEVKLLEFFRNELQYGEAKVIVKEGHPVHVWYALKNVKLD